MRIVNLSAGGDVFLTELVIQLWKKYWYDEVDRFIINFNNHAKVPKSAVGEFLFKMSNDPKIHIIYHPEGVGNGTPIKEGMLVAPDNSLIMLLEDDGFIFKPKKVDTYFKMIEDGSYDAVGSPRGSCGQEVTDAMIKKYNIDINGLGDKGVNYWPNFFFCKKSHLMDTDWNFASKKFPKGVYFPELDHTFDSVNYGDTFVWADIQMRAKGVRFLDVPQFHASPEEIYYFNIKTDKWTPNLDFGWIHGGSLSAGWGGYLQKDIPDVSTEISMLEMETRAAFWTLAVNTTLGYADFRNKYMEGIINLINKANLSKKRIQKKYEIYKNLLGIKEV